MTFKKTLALTTALSAVALLAANAAVAAEKPKLKIGGYQDTFFGIGDMTAGTTSSGTPIFTSGGVTGGQATMLAYGELKFEASGTTDSGMKYGAYFELSMDDGARNVKDTSGAGNPSGKYGADEANVWMSGSWGKLELGNQDGAADKMAVSGTKVDMLGGNILGAFFMTNGTAGVRGTDYTNVGEGADNTKITYYSPRMSGFQVGLSYAPRANAQGTQPAQAGDARDSGNYEAGVTYAGKAGGAKFQIAAVATSFKEQADQTGYGQGIGGQVEMNNITVAAGYAQNKNWRAADSDQDSWNAGIGYNGGKWQVAAYYLEVNGETSTQKSEFREFSLQAGYNFGGGLTGAVGLYDINLKDAGVETNDGQGLIAKLTAKF